MILCGFLRGKFELFAVILQLVLSSMRMSMYLYHTVAKQADCFFHITHYRIFDLIQRIKFGGSVCRIVGPLLGASLEAGHEFLWGPPRPSLHAHDPHEECFKYHIEDLLKMNSFVPEIFLVWNSLKTVHLLFVKWQFYRAQILKVGNRC